MHLVHLCTVLKGAHDFGGIQICKLFVRALYACIIVYEAWSVQGTLEGLRVQKVMLLKHLI